jgi:hypothetical protein
VGEGLKQQVFVCKTMAYALLAFVQPIELGFAKGLAHRQVPIHRNDTNSAVGFAPGPLPKRVGAERLKPAASIPATIP